MRKLRKKLNKLNILIAACLTLIAAYYAYVYTRFNSYQVAPTPLLDENGLRELDVDELQLHSRCLCRKEAVSLSRRLDDNATYAVAVVNMDTRERVEYNVSRTAFERSFASCDLYKWLRRGPGQRVVAYVALDRHLAAQRSSFAYVLADVLRAARRHYPGWTVRVYHDRSLDESLVCQLECARDERGVAFDNVDFCDVTRLPFDLKSSVDLSYMVPGAWRWLPVADSFVDTFVSRDLGSCVGDREIAAVNEWLRLGTLFHVMRDHESHSREMLGGLWGFISGKGRALGGQLLSSITDNYVSAWYRSFGENAHVDDLLLAKFVWPIAVGNVTVHDSFHCDKFDATAVRPRPFPTQRPLNNCYVGQLGCCGSKYSSTQLARPCPRQCRPRQHVDQWSFC